jgi:hypothetical protein
MGRATDSILIPAVGEPTALRRCKIRDVVGLYLHPPQKAVVICVDEKPQIQALERSAPTLPVRPGRPEAARFAALEVATGRSPTPAPSVTATRDLWPHSSRSPPPIPAASYWRALDRVILCPQRISAIAAALVLTSMQRGTR